MPSVTMVVVTKGNTGRARRRKLYQRIAVCFGALFSFLVILYVVQSPTHVQQMSTRLRPGNYHRMRKMPQAAFSAPQPLSEQEMLQLIMNAKVHLVDIHWDTNVIKNSPPGSYQGVYGKFCRVEWGLHKAEPSSFSMYHNLINASPDCANPFTMDLSIVMPAVKAYDQSAESATKVKNLNFTAVTFHESRCGSTLVANMMAAYDPEKNRVYSESPPPLNAMGFACGMNHEHCDIDTSVALLRDVIYLMGRTDDLREERLFFKIQSMGTRSVSIFQKAFPDKPWMFVYRDPIQVLMSHFAHGVMSANCLHQKSHPPQVVHDMAQRHGAGHDARHLTPENYCAAHLATITETAVANLNEHAIPINYSELPDRFYKQVLPHILGAPLTAEQLERVQASAMQYSKGNHGAKHGEFKPGQDNKKKEEMASDEVKAAAAEYLDASFQALEAHRATQSEW